MTKPTPGAVLETVLYARDLAAAEDFYGRVLGLKLYVLVDNRHIFFKLERQMLLIFSPTGRILPVVRSCIYRRDLARCYAHWCWVPGTATARTTSRRTIYL